MTWPNATPADTTMSLSGGVTSAGKAYRGQFVSLSGLLTPSGYLDPAKVAGVIFYVINTGAVAMAGALSKTPSKLMAGVITPVGNAARTQVSKILTAALTPTGYLGRRFIPISGAVNYVICTGAVTISGALTSLKTTLKSLSGAITPTGALAATLLTAGQLVSGLLRAMPVYFRTVATPAWRKTAGLAAYFKTKVVR